MVEPGTGLAILGGSFAARELLLKVLGPTADYIGEGLKDFTQKRVQNVHRIFENAGKKLGDRIENSQAAVPPRILKGILDDGSYCDDALAAEYFGDVLASSRSEVPRDDRGVGMLTLIASMSCYQLRAHYILYSIVKTLYDGSYLELGSAEGRDFSRTLVPLDVFLAGMALNEKESESLLPLLAHITWGLINHGLVDPFNYAAGEGDPVRKLMEEEVPGVGGRIIFSPSGFGAELFLWAIGRGDVFPNQLLSSDIRIEPIDDLEIPPGSRHVAIN